MYVYVCVRVCECGVCECVYVYVRECVRESVGGSVVIECVYVRESGVCIVCVHTCV